MNPPAPHSSIAAFGRVAAALALVLSSACGGGESADGHSNPTANVQGKSSPAKGTSGGGAAKLARAPSRGPEHAVYSLVDNRLAAHEQRGGGLLVNGGTAGFAKYLRFRFKGPDWKLDQTVNGERAATMEGTTGRLSVPLTAAQAKGDVRVRLHVHNDAARRVGLRVNGEKKQEVTVELQPGWSTAETTVPAGAFHAGDNEMLFFASAGAPMSIGWMQVGGAGSDDPDPTYHDGGKALVLPKGGGLAYYVMVPKSGLITADLADPACELAVRAETDGGAVVEGQLIGTGSAVDLSKLAGKPTRLSLTGDGCPRATATNAALVVPGSAPTLTRKPAKPKYVILWIMDALRADRVRPFNPKARPETPVFEKLAKSSSMFMLNYVQGNESKSSHASIWTSLYPINHHYYLNRKSVDVKSEKIDALMKKAGFYTSGISGNGFIIPRHGFGDSWDNFHNHIHEPGGLAGADLMKRALESVKGKTDPWFLYIGTIDTHVSWRAKEPWFSKYDPAPYNGRFKTVASGPDVGKIVGGGIKVDQRDIERIRALYDSNVSYQDDLLGQLMDQLKEWGIADQTMVIVTGDHGDEQFEMGPRRVGHGISLRETLVHTPLVIHYPPLFPAGLVHTGSEVIDIVPTIADALGLPADPAWQGQSLIPIANGVGTDYPDMAMSSQYEEAHTTRVGDWKFEYGRHGAELYDLATEPDEKTDVAAKDPIAFQMMSDSFWLLRTWNADWRKSVWGSAFNVTPAFAAAVNK